MEKWKIEGQYMETCNCDFVCPCITSNLAARPTEGDCKATLVLRIDKGERNGVKLDGVKFIVMLLSPGKMSDGGLTVGLIIDESASPEQVDAVTAIATGAAGGPMAAIGPLVANMAGVERRPIKFTMDGMKRSASAGDLAEIACEGVASAVHEGEPVVIDNVFHPVTTRLALAKATRSRYNAFGIKWDDSSGERNGHFAPFAWAA
jgi:hypothetical protein